MHLVKVNETYLKVLSEPSVIQELSEHLTFAVPGAQFMPAVRNKFWDGKIRLLNGLTGLTYTGLVKEISAFCQSRDYDLKIDKELLPQPHQGNPFDLGIKITPRDYQKKAFRDAISTERGIFLSPTASGKSLIIYSLTKYYNCLENKVLVIVPTVSLVLQMKKDFESYTDEKLDIHCITAGVDKVSDSPIVISTWQSIYKMPKNWFRQFGCVIGDEVHQFKATSLKSIMEKMEDTRYRFGFTGTLDGSLTNKVTLEGLFGPVQKVTTTSELIEQDHIADIKIKAIVLQYPEEERKLVSKKTYQEEVDYIVKHDGRNKFVCNLALSTTKNTLVLFQFVDKHGQILYDMMKTKQPDRSIYFVHGSVDGDDREQIRTIVEKETNAIIVASYGTYSTGINIRNLHNVILASPSKSRVRILQSIGRGLRKNEDKTHVNIYDISDDFKHKSRMNYTLQHFIERVEIYNQENFPIKIYNTELK